MGLGMKRGRKPAGGRDFAVFFTSGRKLEVTNAHSADHAALLARRVAEREGDPGATVRVNPLPYDPTRHKSRVAEAKSQMSGSAAAVAI